jgi:hypothetical protein
MNNIYVLNNFLTNKECGKIYMSATQFINKYNIDIFNQIMLPKGYFSLKCIQELRNMFENNIELNIKKYLTDNIKTKIENINIFNVFYVENNFKYNPIFNFLNTVDVTYIAYIPLNDKNFYNGGNLMYNNIDVNYNNGDLLILPIININQFSFSHLTCGSKFCLIIPIIDKLLTYKTYTTQPINSNFNLLCINDFKVNYYNIINLDITKYPDKSQYNENNFIQTIAFLTIENILSSNDDKLLSYVNNNLNINIHDEVSKYICDDSKLYFIKQNIWLNDFMTQFINNTDEITHYTELKLIHINNNVPLSYRTSNIKGNQKYLHNNIHDGKYTLFFNISESELYFYFPNQNINYILKQTNILIIPNNSLYPFTINIDTDTYVIESILY